MHVKWMLSEINSEEGVKEIFHLKDLFLSINLHPGMELVHFPEFASLRQKEHRFKELLIGLVHHHSGSATIEFRYQRLKCIGLTVFISLEVALEEEAIL